MNCGMFRAFPETDLRKTQQNARSDAAGVCRPFGMPSPDDQDYFAATCTGAESAFA